MHFALIRAKCYLSYVSIQFYLEGGTVLMAGRRQLIGFPVLSEFC